MLILRIFLQDFFQFQMLTIAQRILLILLWVLFFSLELSIIALQLILYSWSFYYAYCKISYIPFLSLTPSPRLTSQHLRLRHHPNQWRILALSLVIPRTIWSPAYKKQLWIILLNARSTFSPSIHINPLSIPTNIQFTTAQPLVKALFFTSATTKMNRAGTVVSSRGYINYNGSIIGLDEQPSVYLIFGTTFTIICLTHSVNK